MLRQFLRPVLRALARLLFRVELRFQGSDFSASRLLVVANHESFLDGLLLGLFLPIDPVFVVHTGIANNFWFRLLLSQDWQGTVQRIERGLRERLAPARALAHVRDVRVLGAIGVIELAAPLRLERIQQRMLEQGIWIRPFGKLVYVMPPYVIDDEQLQRLCDGMVALVASLQDEDMRA